MRINGHIGPRKERRMKVYEKRIGRFFRFEFADGEDILAELSAFAREKGVREASLFIVGAMEEGEAVTGFKNLNGGPFDSELET
jgi:predicted DNA-binding protein with PD1-like motif